MKNTASPLKILVLACAALGLGACASQRLSFQPWKGVPASDLEGLKRGDYAVDKDTLFDAAANTLEHEPFLHWSITSLDKANGFITADAGVLRELQLRVTGPAAPGDVSGGAQSHLAVNIPRRALRTRAKIWVRDDGFRTAYEPEAAEMGRYVVYSAAAELGPDYLRSFTWHVLHDRVQVPFRLDGLDALEEAEAPALAPTADTTPVPIDQAPAGRPLVRPAPGAPEAAPTATPAP
jgi:hypothetical protein